MRTLKKDVPSPHSPRRNEENDIDDDIIIGLLASPPRDRLMPTGEATALQDSGGLACFVNLDDTVKKLAD